ncbi:hamartin [Galleria mellonella]|uniref:Hamartin n=1 Tax=Galleria mellonella TaxID=7137 RepID=A0ABM3MF21_GALME|nr:hamartin [Galleria mellonella]
MLVACEAGEVFALLEGGAGGAREAAEALVALYGGVREPWLTRALLLYHARTGSARALDLLARAPELHARHLLDALQEQLQRERPARLHALAALAPLVARRPAWLHRLPAHPLARDLLRAARLEREPLPLLHALLALAALLPAAPALATPYCADLADVLLRPAALEPPPPPATRTHLQLAQLALFHALYATHPCTLLDTLRADLAGAAAAARDAMQRDLAPLLASVRLHPGLVTGSRHREADPARWARLESHDVVAECRRLSLRAAASPSPAPSPGPGAAPPSPAPAASAAPAAPGSGAHAARSAAALRPGTEPWFPLGDRCGAESAPNTPLPCEPDVGEPPEAAVEATPENTPARETRPQFRYPPESSTVRAIGRRSRPASPPRKETSPCGGEAYAGRLARVALERRAADSPVPFGGTPPAGAVLARPEPSRPHQDTSETAESVDREVVELTERAASECPWPEAEAGAPPPPRDPRRGARPARAARASRPPRRSASCSPRLPAVRHSSVAVQTVDTWPAPYEFLIADFYRNLPDESRKQIGDREFETSTLPSEKLDAYLAEMYEGRGGARPAASGAELAEQLALTHAQLMYERWRREAHAERNRRLLGRCRQVRALELQNAALRERVRAAQLERDELRARRPPAAAPAAAAAAAAPPERELRLEAALADERAARLRSEAALRECEALRAADAAELQRTRAESYEAARHVEALARAALAAERRAEHVRRLRRELLVLAEREARLAEAAAGWRAAPAGGDDRALRAALARAEADAEAAAARADAAALRAHELEAALGARDAVLAELKRAAQLAADEGAARLAAVQDKYAALMCIVRANEARRLELRAAAWPAQRTRAAPPPEPGAAAAAAAAAAGRS